jgi:hypothetical protein
MSGTPLLAMGAAALFDATSGVKRPGRRMVLSLAAWERDQRVDLALRANYIVQLNAPGLSGPIFDMVNRSYVAGPFSFGN